MAELAGLHSERSGLVEVKEKGYKENRSYEHRILFNLSTHHKLAAGLKAAISGAATFKAYTALFTAMRTSAPTSAPITPTLSPADDRLVWVERVARLMDSQFRLPGTRFRFGLDPLLGLLPVVGDMSSFAVSIVLVLTMMRHGASGSLVIRMVLNVLLDAVLGAIPIIGNLFDFAYKANDRNVALLRRHYQEGKYQGSGKGLLVVVLIVLAVFFGLVGWGSYELFHWIWTYFQHKDWA